MLFTNPPSRDSINMDLAYAMHSIHSHHHCFSIRTCTFFFDCFFHSTQDETYFFC
ncbi:unnamed protein product [Amoebophrya sp. A25]|nr:unnamed protein product [Amoebophrya sp. A25]CAD7976605.1 unnamed protein product [Amoebophrya sp. A25]|eukprot:GSA25T00027160001.1